MDRRVPKPSLPTSVRRDYEGISLVSRLGLEICDLAKCETIGGNVIKNDEGIDRRTFRATNAGSFGDALCA
jgi:hypothetical protein